ncbi:MAG: hypothetical protein ACRDTJ_28140, partial [Pseudonocardiaceae bacterium]
LRGPCQAARPVRAAPRARPVGPSVEAPPDGLRPQHAAAGAGFGAFAVRVNGTTARADPLSPASQRCPRGTAYSAPAQYRVKDSPAQSCYTAGLQPTGLPRAALTRVDDLITLTPSPGGIPGAGRDGAQSTIDTAQRAHH